MAVSYRIEVDVIHVPGEVGVVADGVFPETPLPDTAFAGVLAARREPFAIRNASGKRGFDQPPARREIGVVPRQGPDAMQVVGQDDDGVDGERARVARSTECRAQIIDVFHQQPAVTLQQRNMCLKNMMGAIGGWRGRIHVGLHQNIADMNLLLRPDLHVLDATRIMLKNGPSGGSLDDVEVKNLVFAGTDPVALDSLGTGLFGMKPTDLGYIIKSHQAGRGEMDLTKIKVLSS